jgi:inner membrane protein
MNAMNSFVYHGATAQRQAVYPYAINPFHWMGVVETADFFETMPVNSLAPTVDDERGRLYYKPPVTAVTEAAKHSYMGRVYLDWAVFPWTETERLGGNSGHIVQFEDLRYAYPGSGDRPPLAGYVWLGPDLLVVQEGMMGRKGPPIAGRQQSPRD